MEKFYVYELIDPRTDIVFYVGKGKNKRMYDHVKNAKYTNKNSHRLNKIRKILNDGYDDIKYNIIFESTIEDECYKKEKEFIKLYGLQNLTNSTVGGEGGDTFTNNPNKEIVRKKWLGRKSIKKGKSYEELYGIERAHLMKIENSKRQIGKEPWNKGLEGYKVKPRSEQGKRNASIALKNSKKHKEAMTSIEVQNKISNSVSNLWKTQGSIYNSKEYRKKLSIGQILRHKQNQLTKEQLIIAIESIPIKKKVELLKVLDISYPTLDKYLKLYDIKF
jgi:hypothetical protein